MRFLYSWAKSLTAKDSLLSDDEVKKFRVTILGLLEEITKTAVMVGESNLTGMDRGSSPILLNLVQEHLVSMMVAIARRDLSAFRTINVAIENINVVRSRLGAPHLSIVAGPYPSRLTLAI